MSAVFLLAVAVQAAAPPAAAKAGDEIVVTARARRAEAVVRRQVEAILPPRTFDQPLARFTTPICPGVTGLSRASAQAVADRIGVTADELGLRVGEPGCDPNLLVIVVPDGRATVRRLIDRRAGNFRAQALADVRRIVAEPGRARAWAEVETRSRDGDPLVVTPGELATLAVQGPSRISAAYRYDIVSAIVVIDSAAAAGRDPIQIADYAALRGLADARPAKLRGALSVLSAFTPDGDAVAPGRLTDLDRGILRGLYSGQGNVPSGVKQGSIVREIVRRSEVGTNISSDQAPKR